MIEIMRKVIETFRACTISRWPHQGLNGEIPSKINQGKPNNRLSFKKMKHHNEKITSFEPEFVIAA
jgi:hypothetical protein